ncbi:MAG: VOC family protein [Actinomycetota bacterium]
MPRPIHFEFHGDDPDASVSFYAEVFNWETQRWGDFPYWLQMTGEGPGIDGAIAPTEEHGQKVVITMDVDDIDTYRDKVAEAGGTITVEKQAVPTVGWLVMATDPNGVLFGMMQMDESAV